MILPLDTRPASQRSSQFGFTLMEIIIVMIIIAILATLSVGNYINSQRKSRDAARKKDLGQIALSIEAFYNDTGSYPISDNGVLVACGSNPPPQSCGWGGPMIFNDVTYMARIPSDPQTAKSYFYYSPDGSSYVLLARLENADDPDRALMPNGQLAVFQGTQCGADFICNYAISSSNTTPDEEIPLQNEN